MPRHKGNATKKTTMEAGKSRLICLNRSRYPDLEVRLDIVFFLLK
jgi:hypothetical protein